MKAFLTGSLAVTLAVWICLCALSDPAHGAPKKFISLNVAICDDYPPFCTLDDKGRARGWLVDIWRLWSEKTGIKVEFVSAPYGETLRMVGDGRADIHGGLVREPYMIKWLNFSKPLFTFNTSLFYLKKGGPVAPSELTGKDVAVLKDSFFIGLLTQKHPDIAFRQIAAPEQLARALDQGEVRAVAAEAISFQALLTQMGLSEKIIKGATPFSKDPLLAGVAKDRPTLLGQVNKGLAAISPKEILTIKNRQFPRYLAKDETEVTLSQAERKWLTERKTPVVVGAETDWPPFDFVLSGNPTGYSNDLLRLAAQKVGLRLKFVYGLTWAELLKDFRAKKIDILPAIYKTAEREREFALSNYYAANPSVLVVHEKTPDIRRLEDLAGKKLAIVEDFSISRVITKGHREIKTVKADNVLDGLKAVSLGKADAFIGSLGVITYLLGENVIPSLKIVDEVSLEKPEATRLHMATLKDQSILRDILQKGLNAISREDIQALKFRWLPIKALKADSAPRFTLSAQEKKWLAQHPKISIGVMNAWPPITFLSASGKPSGIDIGYLKLLSERLGDIFEIVPGPFKTNLAKARDKKIDAIMDVTPKPERKKYLNFTRPYLNIPHVIVARKESPYYEKEEDLKGKTLALEKGFGAVKAFKKKYPGQIKIVEYPNTAMALDVVSRGRADAYVGNRAVASWIINKELISNLQIQGRRDSVGSVLTIGVRKDWPQLAAIIDRALGDLTTREVKNTRQQWVELKDQGISQTQLTAKEKAFLKDHKKIRLGVHPTWVPFEYFDGQGDYAGICSDYIRILSRQLNIELSPVKGLTWNQMLDEAKAKRVDAVSSIVHTKEREEYLNFTKPYFKAPLVIITRDDAPIVSGLASLKGKTIALGKGYAVQQFIAKERPELRLKLTDNMTEAFRMVADGEAMAAVGTVASLEFVKRKEGIKNLKVAATSPYTYKISIGVRKDWPELVSILDKFLPGFDEKEKALIYEKWLKIRVVRQLDWGDVARVGGLAALVFALILAVVIAWNRRIAGEVAERKKAEERFTSMAANVPGAIFQLHVPFNGKRKYIYLNQQASEFFGAPAEVIINEERLLVIHQDDRKRLENNFQQAVEQEKSINFEGRILLPDGEIKWVRLNGFPTSAADGLIFNGFILDITERKLAEQENLANQRMVMAMSQAVEDALVMIDSNGKMLFWNPAAERLFGYNTEEAKGMSFHDMAAPEKYRNKIAVGLKHFAETGQGPVLGKTTEITARNCRGEEFPVEVTLSSFQLDEKWYAVGTVRDITERKAAEDALRRSQDEFRIIADYTYDWEGWHDAQGRLIWLNPAVERITGYSVEECKAMGDYPLPLIHPDDHQTWRDSLEHALDGKVSNDLPFRVVRRDGLQVWVAISWNPVFDDKGVFTGFRTSAHDFTERKEAENALKASENYMKKILGTALDGFWFIDNQGYTKDVNEAMCRILGRPRDQVVDRHIFDFYDKENLQILKEQLALREKQKETAYEISISRPDGVLIPCLFNATPFLDDSGRKTGSFAMVADISAQKKAELSVRENKQRLDLALEGGNLGIWDADLQASQILVDRRWAELMEVDLEELEDPYRFWRDAVHQDDRRMMDEMMDKYRRGGRDNYEVTYRVVLGSGELRWQVSKGKAVEYDDNGLVTRMVGTIMDVTVQKKAEEELRRNLGELERFSRLMVGREEMMISLKEEINELLKVGGLPKKYKIAN